MALESLKLVSQNIPLTRYRRILSKNNSQGNCKLSNRDFPIFETSEENTLCLCFWDWRSFFLIYSLQVVDDMYMEANFGIEADSKSGSLVTFNGVGNGQVTLYNMKRNWTLTFNPWLQQQKL